MSFRDSMMRRALEMLGDPRIVRLLQSQQVATSLVAFVKTVGQAQASARGAMSQVGRALGIASARELAEVQRRLARVEEEAARLARRLENENS